MPLFTGGPQKWQGEEHNWIQRHSLGVFVTTVLVLQTLLCVWLGSFVFSRQQPLGEGIPTFGYEFWGWWMWMYNVSLVADVFGAGFLIFASKWFYEQGSAESTDE